MEDPERSIEKSFLKEMADKGINNVSAKVVGEGEIRRVFQAADDAINNFVGPTTEEQRKSIAFVAALRSMPEVSPIKFKPSTVGGERNELQAKTD